MVQNAAALTKFFQHVPHAENTFKYINTYAYAISLSLDKIGYVSQETRAKFIDSENFYFHFHYKLFCVKEVHLFEKLKLTSPRLWPIEDICIS